MINAFYTALSGLQNLSQAVDSVSQNLANLSTTGYKATTVAFEDLMYQALGSVSANRGFGYAGSQVTAGRNFSQGTIQSAAGLFNASIVGNGFFAVRNASNATLYTRAGNFVVDSRGYLRTQTGETVQGWSNIKGNIDLNTAVGDIVLPTSQLTTASATREMALTLNLDATGVAGQPAGTFTAPIQIVDSLGAQHTVTVTFTKAASNVWDYSASIPAQDLAGGAGTTLASGRMTFDTAGNLVAPTGPVTFTVPALANGAAPAQINWNLFNRGAGLITQLAQTSTLANSSQDGLQAGQINSLGITDGGKIVASYSSGQQVTVGQIAVALVRNPGTMIAAGNNNYVVTNATATPVLGTADTAGRGSITSGSLEASNVDIATEFTNLIIYQRNYQADSKVVTTSDQMLQTLLSLKQ